MNERDVLIAWRNLFVEGGVSAKSLAKAEALLEDVSGESPLHLRLAAELEDLKKLQGSRKKGKPPAKPRRNP